MRIFLDANILFSAAKSDGFVRRILEQLPAERHVLCAGGYVIAEAHRNIENKAPEGLKALAALIRRLEVAQIQVVAGSVAGAQALPEKDRPVLIAAIHMRCAALVTGDKAHFGRFYGRELGGVTVHSPRSLAEALLK